MSATSSRRGEVVSSGEGWLPDKQLSLQTAMTMHQTSIILQPSSLHARDAVHGHARCPARSARLLGSNAFEVAVAQFGLTRGQRDRAASNPELLG